MASSALTAFGRGIRRAWGWLDASRRFLLNLLLLLALGGLLWLWLRPGPPALKDKTALVLAVEGAVVEQRVALSPRDQALRLGRGDGNAQVALRDLVAALDAGAKEPAITHALLVLDELQGGSLPALRELALAIERFKAAGKPVYAWGSNFDQRQYFVAAHASELWLHPMGGVFVEGYGRHRSYYKELFDKVGITANVIRAGRYKNAAETYSASGPSPETIESDGALFATLWQSWTGAVEKARRQPAGSVAAAIDSLPASLAAVNGNPARWALERKWVDALKTRDEMRALLVDKGAKDEANKTFRQIGWQALLARSKPRTTGDAVGVVVAQGPISDGRAGPGRIGGLSTSELIRQAREDDKIKAVVLRVDSPGGSAFGSELVRRELELTRKAGKPVVVSMAGLAASGGYWISMAADEIIADEATVTGSIGVVGLLPTAEGAMDKLGIRSAGTTTTWLGNAYDIKRPLDPRFVQLVQTVIDGAYRDFTGIVASARKSTPEKIHELAQGRVWSGKDALARGLVDRTGGLRDAVASAAQRAKMEAEPRLVYIETPPGRLQRLLERLGLAEATALLPGLQAWLVPAATLGATPPALVRELAPDLAWLAEVAERREPLAATVHCLCAAP
jgi:protease-4